MRAFQITLPYACFGIIAVDNIVTDAAPIAKWMIGNELKNIRGWLISSNAKVVEL